MKSRVAILCSILLVNFIGESALAETHRVELGWGNIDNCRTLEWRNDGIFGTPSPTYRESEQRVYAFALIDAPTLPGIQNDIQQCAVQGAAAAGLSTIILTPAAAYPSFQAAFGACMSQRSQDWASFSLNLSEGQCM